MRSLFVTAVAALALGLGSAAVSAAQTVGSRAPRAQVPDGIIQGEREEDRGRRWMRSWRDEERAAREAPAGRGWGEAAGGRVKCSAASGERARAERPAPREDDSDGARRPPKPRS